MPLWNLGMSLGQFVMAGGWLLAGNLKARLTQTFRQPVFWLLISLFLLHVIGLWNTSDVHYGAKDIKVKLPLLLMPLLLLAGPPLSVKQLRITLHFLFAGVLVSSLTGWAVYMGWTGVEVNDFRSLSIFISHIRLSLLMDVCIVLCCYFSFHAASLPGKILYMAFAGWCCYFLLLLQSITGISLLLLVFAAAVGFYGLKNKKRSVHIGATLFLLLFLFGGWKGYEYVFIQSIQPIKTETAILPTHTAKGNAYQNDRKRQDIEDGRLVWRQYNELEIDTAWMKRSARRVWDLDQQGHMQLVTLMRYLTAKNLKKDAEGVALLTEQDVLLIEKGFPTPASVAGKNKLVYRLKEMAAEYRNYYYNGDANGHSFAQRLEYWKAAKNIIAQHPLTGVGTGDVPAAFQSMYVEMKSTLSDQWRLRAHNQYLSLGVAFGWPGILLFLFVLFYCFRLGWQRSDFIYLAFLLIALGSFFNEDTLETQAGVTFFAFLNAFFLRSKMN